MVTHETKNLKIDENLIPFHVKQIIKTLENAGFEAFLVGGAVRDLIMNVTHVTNGQLDREVTHETKREPKDWDITTNAKHDQIEALFEKTFYENTFGTVTVCIPKENVTHITNEAENGKVTHETKKEEKYDMVQVTTYRTESKYEDSRRPEAVEFVDTIEKDLARRDFTMNAVAYDLSKGHFIDPYDGITDIKDKSIRCVGLPDERLSEDGLRIMRAIRFASQLGFTISNETFNSLIKNKDVLQKISMERIRDEFVKIINSPDATIGIEMLRKIGAIKYIVPELEEGVGCIQGGEHTLDVYDHLLYALDFAVKKDYPFHIRIAALFHDIGKPRSRRERKDKNSTKKPYTFYGHEVIGAKMVKTIMERLKFPNETTNIVCKLVRYHMFFSDTEQITLSAVRRIIVNVGQDSIWDLMKIRECDRAGMKKSESPYRLRKYYAMIEEALRSPISVSQLKIDGKIMIEDLKIQAGRKMGWILLALLEEVLENPEKNTREYLDKRALELNDLSESELKNLGEKAKNTKDELEEENIKELNKKYGVK